jgi:Methyltransferase domain
VFISHFRLKTTVQNLIFTLQDFADYGSLHPARELKRIALQQTVAFIQDEMPRAVGVASGRQVLDIALAATKSVGHVTEFGVYKGGTIRFIARRLPRRQVHGFDSFAGLPESWTGDAFNYDARGKAPQVPSNVELHSGLFADSIPRWLAEHPGPAAFVHIDSDLYSSAKCVLDLIEARIIPGTVIVFDEYFNYPGWKDGEHKAFGELKARAGLACEYLAYSRFQLALRVKSRLPR